ncbi:extracellular ribonuclease LE [Tanacetum coccineum]
MEYLSRSGRRPEKEVVVEPDNDDKYIDVNDELQDDDFVGMGGNSSYASDNEGHRFLLAFDLKYGAVIVFDQKKKDTIVKKSKLKKGAKKTNSIVAEMLLDEVRRRRPPLPFKVTCYTLAVQWPPGVCSGKDDTCKIPKVPTQFKIHGLWPEYSPKDPPTPKTFDINLLGVLTTELEKSWPNLWSEQQQLVYNLLFWNAEWNKHGRFSKMEGLDYFRKTLDLFKDVGQGLKGTLEAKGIKPVNAEFSKKTYTLVEIKTTQQNINGGLSCTVRCVS